MRPTEKIKKLFVKSNVTVSSELDDKIINDAFQAFENSRKTKSAALQPNIWRIIMKSRITKLAAAAVIIIAVLIGISHLGGPIDIATPAYGLEQTIQAGRGIRYLHLKYFAPSGENVLKEAWIEHGEDEEVKNVRVNYYGWGGHDMVQVWREGKTLHLNKTKETLNSFECEVQTAKMLKFASRYDPKQAVKLLYELEKKGEVKIEIEEPSDEAEPILVKGTYLPGTYCLENPTLPGFQDVLYVDQATKLVTAIQIYELMEDGESKDCGIWKCVDYREPLKPDIFNLEEEISSEVIRIEHYTGADVNDQGLEQGAYTNQQVAFIVVQEFFNALIDDDYAKAGRLFGGMAADEAEERFGDLNILRIVSIGEPVKSEKPSGLRVPCTIEIESDGKIIEWQPKGPYVRQVYRHAGHWRIIGGI